MSPNVALILKQVKNIWGWGVGRRMIHFPVGQCCFHPIMGKNIWGEGIHHTMSNVAPTLNPTFNCGGGGAYIIHIGQNVTVTLNPTIKYLVPLPQGCQVRRMQKRGECASLEIGGGDTFDRKSVRFTTVRSCKHRCH